MGPDEFARWGVRLDFTDGPLEAFGKHSDIVPVGPGHPCVSSHSFPGDHSDIHVQVLPTLAEGGAAPSSGPDRTLGAHPRVAEAGAAFSSGSNGTSVAAQLAEHHAACLQDEDDEASSWSGVAEMDDVGYDARNAVTSDEDMPPLGSGTANSESSTDTSDHYRGETGTESEEGSDCDGPSEIFQAQIGRNEVFMNKGKWRHVRGNVTHIKEYL